ncbi:DUF29 domain-containing protein [Synechocystis salina LEGE 06155]|nr:DUF29 domain-containing protein [Synechocystis salina LEGE 06155]
MVVELRKTNKSLYEMDYNLWVLDTVDKLKNQDLDGLDWENLIGEVEDLSRRDKKKLKSLLRLLFEHILKLTYWQSEATRNQGHWRGEIRNFRKQIKDELQDSPSLKNYVNEVLSECYQDSREIVSDKTQLPLSTFPEKLIASLEQLLDENWLP